MNKEEKKKVLVIEDEVFIAGLISDSLSKSGFEIDLAEDGDTALKKIKKAPYPDIILLDLILPGTGGFDVLESVKKDDETKNIPVVILSNLGSQEEIDRGLKLGADKYFIKANVLPEQVVEYIKSVLKSS